jgi:hypothetical protein
VESKRWKAVDPLDVAECRYSGKSMCAKCNELKQYQYMMHFGQLMERALDVATRNKEGLVDARTKSKQWFLTANGYTVSLSRMKDRIRHQQVRSIFRGLWDSRTRSLDGLPATHIAKSYLAVLLALNDDLQAEIIQLVGKPGLLRNRNARTGRSTK